MFVLLVHMINKDKLLSCYYDSFVTSGVEPYRKLLMSKVSPQDTDVMFLVIFWGNWVVI